MGRPSGRVWFGFLAGAVGGQTEGQSWPRSGPAGVWTQSWRGRSESKPGLVDLETAQGSRSQEVSSDSKSGVWEGWGLRGWPLGGQDPIAEVSEKVTGCLGEEGQRSSS